MARPAEEHTDEGRGGVGCLVLEVGFANFSDQGNPPGGGPLDRFDMRGLILFYVMGILLTLPWKLCI